MPPLMGPVAGAGIPLALGAAGGLMGGMGNRRQQTQQNQIFQNAASMYGGQNMQNLMGGYNPMLMAALLGPQASRQAGLMPHQYRGSGWFQNLSNLAQNPGYMDPQLMNAPLQASAQKGQQDLVAAQGKLGRSGMGGGYLGSGMFNAYALANQAAQTQRDTAIQQQYALQREMQRRQDMQWLGNMYNQNLGYGMQGAGGMGQMLAMQNAPQNWLQTAAGMLGGGLGSYGAMG